jgi:hypothetical protein
MVSRYCGKLVNSPNREEAIGIWAVAARRSRQQLDAGGELSAMGGSLRSNNQGDDARRRVPAAHRVRKLVTEAALSIPTPDHSLPLLYVIATRQQGETSTFPVNGVDGGSISMLAIEVA